MLTLYFCTIPGFSPGSLWPVLNFKQRRESDDLPDGNKSCQNHEQRPSLAGRCCQLGGGSKQATGCERRADHGPEFCSHQVQDSNRVGEWPSDIAVVTVTVTFFV